MYLSVQSWRTESKGLQTDMTEKKAADKIKRIDRERKYYYESHTGLEWGSPLSHQLLLNVSRLGMKETSDVLEMMYRGE